MAKWQKSKYIPKNLHKYEGDPHNIIARSSWERKFFIRCDTDPAILKWASERTIVRYLCPTDGAWHRYYVDVKITVKERTGAIKTYLTEIKPLVQTKEPRVPRTKTPKARARYITECRTYAKNQAKWAAARKFCEARGWEFIILTENELGIKQ